MLRIFIFDDSKTQWVEESQSILSQDICALLDDEEEIIYLWKGLKTNKKKIKKGYRQIKELISNFPELNLQLIMVEKNFPIQVKEKLDSMLDSVKKERSKILLFTRFITIRIYFISLLVGIILPIINILNLSRPFFWPISDETYQVKNSIFHWWMNNSKILMLITLICFIINLVIGILEVESQAIVFSTVGLIICAGLFIYLNFDIYLFSFQEGSTLTNFLILKRDILFFILIVLISILIFEIPNTYKLISFLKTYRKFIF
ncbi:MAG: hypothetical protein ACFFA0_12740 [Promethearchaeota archaeon]